MDIDVQSFYRVSIALAIGLLVGIERGWQGRSAQDGQRMAGLRTFGLVGLVGGVAGLLAEQFGVLLIGLTFVGVSIVAAAAYLGTSRHQQDIGLTTEIALLATFMLCALAGLGELALASASAVIMVFLLGYKTLLHGWLNALREPELTAGFKLLLISVVLLPLLPDKGYGPWQALNPYMIWWMVVLIAAISFFGYFAIRIAGARAGTLFTALFGGFASSTATTLNFARLAQKGVVDPSLLACGILLACGTMFPRILLVSTLVHPPLLKQLWLPMLGMSVLAYAPLLWWLRSGGEPPRREDVLPKNPMELKTALSFGALLMLVMLLGYGLSDWFGDAGIWALAITSGIADVDPITLSLAKMSQHKLALDTATLGIVLAASANTCVKAGLALVIGGQAVGLRVLAGLLPAILAGLALTLYAP